MRHATVEIDGVKIPLIGVPKSATEEECDLCHDLFHIQHLEWSGRQLLCERCKKEVMPHAESLGTYNPGESALPIRVATGGRASG